LPDHADGTLRGSTMRTGRFSIGYSIPNDDDYGLVKLGPALDEAERMGVDCVELPLYAIDVVAGGRVIPERLRKVKEITSGRSIGYTVHGPLRLNLMVQPDLLPLHRNVLRAMLEVAAELGGRHFVAHSGCLPVHTANPAPRIERQRDILAEMGDLAAASGIIIAVENLFGGNDAMAMLPSELAREIDALGHPSVRACLDFSHAYLLCTKRGVSFLDEAAALAPYARHLHVHDSFGMLAESHFSYRAERLAYGLGDLHLPMGMGSIPWDDLAERCEFPADPIFIHELAPPYWSDLADAIGNMRAFAEKTKIRGKS
jgi:sugar phosphate isomerase/epimerase